MRQLLTWFNMIIKKQKKLKRWQRIMTALASVIIFATTYALILPAITVEKDTTEDVSGMYLDPVTGQDDMLEDDALEPAGVTIAADQQNAVTYSYADDNIRALAVFSTDEDIPEGAELVVNYVDPDSSEYTDLCSRSVSLLEKEFIYDITTCSFYDYALVCDNVDVTPKTGLSDIQIIFNNNTVEHIDDVVFAGKFERPAKTADGLVELSADDLTNMEEVPDRTGDALISVNPDESSVAELFNNVIMSFSLKGNDLAESDSIVGILAGRVDEEVRAEAAETDAEIPIVGESQEENDNENISEDGNEEAIPDTGVKSLKAVGSDYTVILTYDGTSAIPAGATLKVDEILQGTDEYNTYLDAARKAMGLTEEETLPRCAARFFDIKIKVGDREVTPDSGVSVEISYTEPLAEVPDNEVNAVHFADDANEAELVEATTTDVKDDGTATVEFTADSFSVYGVIYTVDFKWEVDGKKYEFSIPGGDTLSLKELLTALNVKPEEEVQEFVNNISTVEFSDSKLIHVSKVEEDITAGELKEQLDLELEYSANLTEEQLSEMDAKQLKAIDWALVTLKAFDTEETLTITMADGEVFTIKVTDERDPLGLDGQTYAILTNKVSNGSTRTHTLQANVHTRRDDRGYYLESKTINKNDGTQYALNSYDGLEYVASDATAWTFEYDEDAEAYYISYNGKYLYIDPKIESKNDSRDHSLNLVNTKTVADGGTLITITKENGNYYLGNAKGTMLWDYGNGYWLSNENDPAETDSKENNAAVHLCMPENPTENASHKAAMISIQDTQPGQRLIIYQRVLQPDNTYKEYAINGDGQLVEVFPSSDSVYWKGNQSIEWEMADLGNGYYTLKNTVTGAYLSPKGGQTPTIVHQDSDYTSNPDELRVTLPDKGAKGNPYTSLISCWDYTNNVTEGLKVTCDGNSATLSSVLSDDAQKFYFASRDPIVTGQLTTVKTVDNDDHGIKMTMFDFTSNSYPNARVPYHTYVMGGESWGEGVLNQGIMGRTLYTGKTGWNGNHYYINGFPNSNITGRSYGLVFQDDDVGSYNYSIRSEKEANHLFVQSVYDSTGYFHYSSFENFARFNETTGNFTVYDQIGTPACLNDDWNAAYQNRGNFMPYNDLNVASSKSHTYNGQTVYGNWYQSGNSDPLPDDDPRKGERLYQLEGVTDHTNTSYNKLDYFFGMIMEAKFMQGEDGLTDRGDPTRYEFNGDDDLYVYVDNVLLLDIGGVHDAFRGYIDFSTGDIEVYPATKQSDNMFLGSKTTIKRQYWEAGQFPNGDPWDHNVYPYDCDKANEFFDGETFRDYSTHDFKMFYMERGAGASNLQIDFNLMTLTDSQFRVKKEMPETQNGGEIQQDYTDAAFYYEAWVKGENDSDYQKVTRTYLEGLNTQQDKTPRYQDGTPVEWKTDDPNETKFVVRPGQTAVFPAVDDSVRWYVKEVEPESNSQMLSYYQVSNSDQDISDPTGSTSNKDLIKNRNIVIYQNRPNDDLVNELRITKKVIGTPYNADDKFEYRILLEDTNGNMGPYKEGPYYQLDKDGNYVYFEQGERKTQTMPRVAEKTSINGSVNNILDGDTIIIKGLLEGTDFYVYERTDTSYGNIALNATPVENKYVFVGTDMTGAFNRRTDDPQTYDFGHSVGHLFDAPSGLDGMIENYGISEYEQSLAARGAILKDSDTDVTVKNKPYHPIDITVEKKWPADSADFNMDSDLENAATTFTVKRYKLDARHGTVNLTGILNSPPHTGADPVYHFRKDGQLIKSIAYSDLVKDANDPNRGTLKVTDLPIGDYVITTDDYIVGYDISHEVTPTDTISVTEGSETDVTVTTHYGRQYGSMTIRKTLSGNYASHQNDRFIYTVHGPDGFSFTAEKYARDAENGVITIDVMNDGVPDLPSGNYVVSEAVVNSDTSGQGLSGNHTPSSQSVYVNDHQRAYADFTGDYANPLIPVTIHVGHDQNGFYEDKSSVYYLPVGKTVTVTTSVKLCPYYSEGVYAYGPTRACTAGVLSDTFDARNTDWVSRTFTFSIPENVTSYNYYIKTKCNQASWDPTIISAVSSNQNRLMMGAARRSAAPAGPAKAGTSGGSIYNSVTDNSLPTLIAEEQAKEKFVIDDSWTMTVVLTKDDYKAYLGNDTTTTPVVTGDTTTGTSFWDALLSHESIVSEDENGNLYYYYIDSFKEDGITQRMEPSFDMDPDDSTKTLMTSRDKKQKLSVSNELITTGSLTITKEVTVNGQEVTDHTGPSPADGTYTFKLTKKNDNSFAERTITLTIENGVTVTSTAITDLKAGEYTVTEQTPTNGTTLTKIDGVSVSTSGGDVTVTAGETANIRFTNNIGQTEITVKKVDAEKAANAEDRFLANAKFSLLDSDGHTVSGIQTIKITDLNTGSDIIPDANNEFTIPITGIKIAGLPDGSYRLVEKKAPDGYIITNPVTTFTVSQGVVTAWSLTGTAGAAFEIPNPPGTELPMTGGSGTGLFTILGSILITGAGLLLWRRRRLI